MVASRGGGRLKKYKEVGRVRIINAKSYLIIESLSAIAEKEQSDEFDIPIQTLLVVNIVAI